MEQDKGLSIDQMDFDTTIAQDPQEPTTPAGSPAAPAEPRDPDGGGGSSSQPDPNIDPSVNDTDGGELTEQQKQTLQKYNGHDFDGNGNIVDQNGNIVAYKDQIEEATGEGEEKVIDQFMKEFGYNFEDEEFPDTLDGLKRYTIRVANQVAQDQFNTLVSKDPLVKEVLEYVNQGGNPRELLYSKYPEKDYRTVKFDKEDTEFHKQVVRDYRKEQGEEDDDINEEIKDLEQQGKLPERAEKMHNKLAKIQEDKEEQKKEEQRAAEERKIEENKQFWTKVWNDHVKKGEVGGIKIDNPQKFFEYISSQADTQGHTQEQIDWANADMEKILVRSLLMYYGGNMAKLASQIEDSKSAASLKSLINKDEASKQKGKGGRSPGTEEEGSISDLSLDKMLTPGAEQ